MMLQELQPKIGSRTNQQSFATVPTTDIQRSKLDRSHGVKDIIDFDYLNTILVDEVLPGDTINCNVNSFARLATQVVPVLDNMYLDFFFFFVPNRLVWNNWQKFMGEQENPGDSIDYTVPQCEVDPSTGDIFDKMGLTPAPSAYNVNAMFLRAYNLVYNDWFRDQNLQDSVTVNKGDGPDSASDYSLLKRGKKHDYFTSCLPWPQKFDAVTLPLAGNAPVYGPEQTGNADGNLWMGYNTTDATIAYGPMLTTSGSGNPSQRDTATGSGAWRDTSDNVVNVSLAKEAHYTAQGGQYEPPYADLGEATNVTLNQFREAIMLQAMGELDARGGTRYTEIVRSHFKVVSPDQRLQRPEYLGGGSTMFNQHPVPQTSESGTTEQGTLAAFTTASTHGKQVGFTKSFVEHGILLGLCAARADITYQTALDKMWTRQTRYDYFWPKLQLMGEQAVLNKEIDAAAGSGLDDVFGYQERYAEYRFKNSYIKGQLRSDASNSLDVWHLAEDISGPSLNDTFIQSTTPIDRVLAVENEGHIKLDMFIRYIHARPMVARPIPATLGRF